MNENSLIQQLLSPIVFMQGSVRLLNNALHCPARIFILIWNHKFIV